MAPTLFKCRFCTFKTRHNKGLSSHYLQIWCGTKLAEHSKYSPIKKRVREAIRELQESSPADSTDSNDDANDDLNMLYFSHHTKPDIPAPPSLKRVHIKDVEDEGNNSYGPE
ncbi:uncharacterized protein ARMOST_19409 [Armillaria ostoyae]|uniref:Uncharacterized protein n=1 Tax=Armillaria ostoyae TaxID=47428 RepID=A0A284S4G8_ARMOS|nr:uncharacterized protein ARMOST_19409 [Armillaria ostoyae]